MRAHKAQWALHRALKRGELRLFYQPEVALPDGRTLGVEALIRWQHPDRGLLAPAAFLPVAEASGLIVPIGTWVISEACRQLAAWQSAHPALASLGVWVNVSPRQLAQPGLVDVIRRALDRTGLDPTRLGLELTEAAFLDASSVGGTLVALKGLGVRLALDDFGTGYSCINYLKALPIDVIKIDRSFVAGLGSDPRDEAIVTAIVGLARAFGLSTIAEGVETPDQLARIWTLGCDRAQGYYLGRPVPPEAIEEDVAQGSGARTAALAPL